MKKQYVTILVLAALLTAVIAGNRVISCVADKKQAERESQSEAESLANTIHVTTIENVDRMTIGEFSFEKNGDEWTYLGDSSFPLDSSIVDSIYDELATLTSSRKLVDGDEPAAYGLEEPAYTAILENAAGDTQTIKVGNAIDSEYYVMTDGEDTVYTAALSTLSKWSDDILTYAAIEDTASLWKDNPISIALSSSDDDVILNKASDDNWTVSINGGDAYDCENSTQISTTLSDIELTYTSCLGYNVAREDYGRYGLDKPLYTLTVNYQDGDEKECAITYYVGSLDSENSTYAVMSSNSDEVYSVAKTSIDNFATILSYDYLEES